MIFSIQNEAEQIKVVEKQEGVDTDDPVPFRTFPDYNSPPGVIITSQGILVQSHKCLPSIEPQPFLIFNLFK